MLAWERSSISVVCMITTAAVKATQLAMRNPWLSFCERCTPNKRSTKGRLVSHQPAVRVTKSAAA
ncbi:MAG: hypothetical protein KDL09_02080 [Prosthecobacter sp.]|nr:hypothetical protein [Prosthecobacter sp.]